MIVEPQIDADEMKKKLNAVDTVLFITHISAFICGEKSYQPLSRDDWIE
jgi:hypothetical protein